VASELLPRAFDRNSRKMFKSSHAHTSLETDPSREGKSNCNCTPLQIAFIKPVFFFILLGIVYLNLWLGPVRHELNVGIQAGVQDFLDCCCKEGCNIVCESVHRGLVAGLGEANAKSDLDRHARDVQIKNTINWTSNLIWRSVDFLAAELLHLGDVIDAMERLKPHELLRLAVGGLHEVSH